MNKSLFQKITPILITSAVIGLTGWIGLFFLVQYTQPFLGPRWVFFFLLTMALSATALPVIFFLNLRFPSTPPVNAIVLIRQSIWFAIFFDLLAWLQLGRVLNGLLIGVLAIGIIVIENLIRLVERSRWHPVEENEG
ncbi:MAG: hypothetical protein CVU39_25480 [Chloroflexi bacterium HGW-Chloroflexi-10]|nr:MAG: hypothetical protein CVU39_25480 [Chloroflexi bacterium HGW-Chloroflexi-10]